MAISSWEAYKVLQDVYHIGTGKASDCTTVPAQLENHIGYKNITVEPIFASGSDHFATKPAALIPLKLYGTKMS